MFFYYFCFLVNIDKEINLFTGSLKGDRTLGITPLESSNDGEKKRSNSLSESSPSSQGWTVMKKPDLRIMKTEENLNSIDKRQNFSRVI